MSPPHLSSLHPSPTLPPSSLSTFSPLLTPAPPLVAQFLCPVRTAWFNGAQPSPLDFSATAVSVPNDPRNAAYTGPRTGPNSTSASPSAAAAAAIGRKAATTTAAASTRGTREERRAAAAAAAARTAAAARADAAALAALAVQVKAGGVQYSVLPRAVVALRGSGGAGGGGGAERRADGGGAGVRGGGLGAESVTLVTQISRNRCVPACSSRPRRFSLHPAFDRDQSTHRLPALPCL
jgi:hypothetical protein